MSLLLLILLIGGSLASTTRLQKVYYDPDEAEVHFEEFVRTFGRRYENDDEKQMRLEIFREKLKDINRLNDEQEYAVFGITEFTDYTTEELDKLGCVSAKDIKNLNSACQQQYYNATLRFADDSFDWRDRNAVTPVKDQGRCSSCWAFSSIGSLESQYVIKHGQMMSFSEQQLVDCDHRSHGCNGGLMDYAFESIMEQGGIMSETDYPYAGTQQACQFDRSRAAAQVTGCTTYRPSDEGAVAQLLVDNGPLSFIIDATTVHQYRGGILKIPCVPYNPYRLHALLLVGYGTENGVAYWIVKNSWGVNWGEQGFFRMLRGSDFCGMLENILVSPQVA